MAERRSRPTDPDAVEGRVGRRRGRTPRRTAERAASRLEQRAPGRHVPGAALSAFLDDELDDDAALKLTRHVTSCAECRAELEALRGTRSALRRLRALQAPVLTAERRSHPRVRTWSRRLLVVGLLLTTVVGLLVAAYVVGGEGEVVPPVERFLLDHLARTGDGPMPTPFGGLGR